jgi:hypothetical protein
MNDALTTDMWNADDDRNVKDETEWIMATNVRTLYDDVDDDEDATTMMDAIVIVTLFVMIINLFLMVM